MSAIEQDHEKLLAITTFTFDLEDADFVAYFEARTGQLISQVACGWRRVKELLEDPPDLSWKLTRAKLQNCWELYQNVTVYRIDPSTPKLADKPVQIILPPIEEYERFTQPTLF